MQGLVSWLILLISNFIILQLSVHFYRVILESTTGRFRLFLALRLVFTLHKYEKLAWAERENICTSAWRRRALCLVGVHDSYLSCTKPGSSVLAKHFYKYRENEALFHGKISFN